MCSLVRGVLWVKWENTVLSQEIELFDAPFGWFFVIKSRLHCDVHCVWRLAECDDRFIGKSFGCFMDALCGLGVIEGQQVACDWGTICQLKMVIDIEV